MGLQLEYIQFINDSVAAAGLKPRPGVTMCELGNQHLRKSARSLTKAKTGKEYFRSLGFEHTSIDWNGLDGAMALDLRQPIQNSALLGKFDVLTNSGTSEHVENQYECFKNIHQLVKARGLMVHLNPMTGSWPGHGLYYYTFDFFRRLAQACQYEWLLEKDLAVKGDQSHLVCVALRKAQENAFIDQHEFDQLAQGTILNS